jgi:hypothetical protein
MVPALELTKEEVLERLRKVLKGVTIVLHVVPEYCGDNPLPAVSCFTFGEYFPLYIFCCWYFLSLIFCLFLLLWLSCRNWDVTLLIRFLLMTTQLLRRLEEVWS